MRYATEYGQVKVSQKKKKSTAGLSIPHDILMELERFSAQNNFNRTEAILLAIRLMLDAERAAGVKAREPDASMVSATDSTICRPQILT